MYQSTASTRAGADSGFTVAVSGGVWALMLRQLAVLESNELRAALIGTVSRRAAAIADSDAGGEQDVCVAISGFALTRCDHAPLDAASFESTRGAAPWRALVASSDSAPGVVGAVHFRRASTGAPGTASLSAAERAYLKSDSARAVDAAPRLLVIVVELDGGDAATRSVEFVVYYATPSGALRTAPMVVTSMGSTALDFRAVAEMATTRTSVAPAQHAAPLPKSLIQRSFAAAVDQLGALGAAHDERVALVARQRREVADLLAARSALLRDAAAPVAAPAAAHAPAPHGGHSDADTTLDRLFGVREPAGAGADVSHSARSGDEHSAAASSATVEPVHMPPRASTAPASMGRSLSSTEAQEDAFGAAPAPQRRGGDSKSALSE
jgi:hypothetical protein